MSARALTKAPKMLRLISENHQSPKNVRLISESKKECKRNWSTSNQNKVEINKIWLFVSALLMTNAVGFGGILGDCLHQILDIVFVYLGPVLTSAETKRNSVRSEEQLVTLVSPDSCISESLSSFIRISNLHTCCSRILAIRRSGFQVQPATFENSFACLKIIYSIPSSESFHD